MSFVNSLNKPVIVCEEVKLKVTSSGYIGAPASLPELSSTCTAIFNQPHPFTAVWCCFWGVSTPDPCLFECSAMKAVFWTRLHTRSLESGGLESGLHALRFIFAMKAIQPNFRKQTAIDDAYFVISVTKHSQDKWKMLTGWQGNWILVRNMGRKNDSINEIAQTVLVSPVFRVTWSFSNYSNMLIWCSKKIHLYSWYNQQKQVLFFAGLLLLKMNVVLKIYTFTGKVK